MVLCPFDVDAIMMKYSPSQILSYAYKDFGGLAELKTFSEYERFWRIYMIIVILSSRLSTDSPSSISSEFTTQQAIVLSFDFVDVANVYFDDIKQFYSAFRSCSPPTSWF